MIADDHCLLAVCKRLLHALRQCAAHRTQRRRSQQLMRTSLDVWTRDRKSVALRQWVNTTTKAV